MSEIDDAATITSPFSLVIDTREQAPWHFTGITTRDKDRTAFVLVPTILRGLKTGDYAIDGLEHLFAVERKSLADWYGSIGRERERFEREIERLGQMKSGHVVIEAEFQMIVERPPTATQVPPAAAVGTMASWSQRYGVHFWCLPGRRAAELWAYRLAEHFWRQWQREQQEQQAQAANANGV